MSRWQEQFEQHQIHQTLEQLIEWLNVELDDLNEEQIEEIRRCNKVISLFKATIEKLEPEVTPFPQLDSLNQTLRHQSLWSQLNNFSQNKNVQHVTNANNHLSSAMHFLTWLVPYTKVKAATESVKSLESAVDQSMNVLVKRKSELDEAISQMSSSLTNLVAQKDKLENTIEQRRQEVDQQISQWQQQFSDAQDKRTESYNEWRNKVESDIKKVTSSLVDATQTEVETLEQNTKEEITQILTDAKEKHQEIKDLFQLASGDSISGGYSQFADKERFQSHLWRGVAVLFICLTAWWIFSAYENVKLPQDNALPAVAVTIEAKVESKDTETKIATDNNQTSKPVISSFDWHKFLLSFSLTGVLLFGAGFAGQQSNRHRENEKRMRWFALQIKALDPYINSLDPEDQKELKKTLSEKFFNGAHENEVPQGMVDEHAIGVVAKAMTDAIKAARS